MSLDDSKLRKLRKEIDEIQVDLNAYLDCLLPDSLKGIKLIISEDNFVQEEANCDTLFHLLKTVRELIEPRSTKFNICGETREKEVDVFLDGELKDKFRDLIRKKHISTAKTLLKQGKCKELVRQLLIEAMKLSGKKDFWTLEDDETTYTLEPKEVGKFTTKEVGGLTLITGLESTFNQPGLKISVLDHTQGHQQEVYATELVGKVFQHEVVDLDEISELAAQTLSFEKEKHDFNGNTFLFQEASDNCIAIGGGRYRKTSNGCTYSDADCSKHQRC